MSAHVPRRRSVNTLAAQIRVIHALVIREMQLRFGQSRLGYLWLVGEPMILAVGISTVHWVSGHGLPNNIPIFLFYGLGYAPFFMFRSIMARNATAVVGSSNLLFHRSIKLHDLTMSRTVLEAAACIPVILIFVLGGIIFAGIWPSDPGLFVLSLIFSALLGHGLGTLTAALIVFFEPLERVVHPLTYLMMPLSGAFGMLDSLPEGARNVLLYNPLAHVHEALRYAQWGDRLVAYYSIPYILICILVLNLVAIAALRAARPHVSISM
ncbi:ABC transporter permease [Roseomonas marmotae]|uniref:ABC transporter permease n=1 Tax=Roseomonas marmotae TaxID=2768161 RepID=A0ABS3KEZ4_9PROT|nr:ABC transporter permease [Roseomonas marmotae]MBO1076013.1 ABC transporter permease [Roseomonas marmotae]QTI80144.1 ABC transporter permease [Roseomonas marmotae]